MRDGENADAGKRATALHAEDSAYSRQLLSYKLNKHKGNASKRQAYLAGPSIAVLKEAMAAKEPDLVGHLISLIGFIPKANLIVIATQEPDFFLDEVLKRLQKDVTLTDKFRELLMDNYFDASQTQLGGATGQDRRSEGLRGMLRARLGAKWVDFAKSIPMLAPSEEASEHFAAQEEEPDEKDIVDRIFESFVKNQGINIGYFTVAKDRTEQIMMGKAGGINANLGELPEVLRTHCDDIMKILREAVRAYPALDVNFTIGMEKQALLTKPLDGLPGGLIPNSFQGNVRNRAGEWTKQIFFTGVQDTTEPNSHTWLLINGRQYDAVLGTKGPEVAASKQAAFTQVKTDDDTYQAVWRDGAGNELRKLEGVTAPANPMGFGTAYEIGPVGGT